MIASEQALQTLMKEIDKERHDLEVTEKDLKRREMGLVDMKKKFEEEQVRVNNLRDVVNRFKSQMSRHLIEVDQMRAYLIKSMKKQ